MRFQTVLGLRRTVVCLIKDSLDVCKSWLLTDSRLVLYEVRSHVTYRKAAMPLDELIGRAVKRVAVEIIFIQLNRERTFALCIESCSRLPCSIFVFSRRKEMWNVTAFPRKKTFRNDIDRLFDAPIWLHNNEVFECSPDHLFKNDLIHTRQGSSVQTNYPRKFVCQDELLWQFKRMIHHRRIIRDQLLFSSFKFVADGWSVSNKSEALKNYRIV